MKLIFILTIFFSTFVDCKSQNCETFPKSFESYEAAIQLIDLTEFEFKDNVNTLKSSWLSYAKYYSCDSKKGFFIIKTTKNYEYIHQDLPIEIWNQFKNAYSFGQFYNERIRGKYRLSLN